MTFEGLPVTLMRRKGQHRLRLSMRSNQIVVSGPYWASTKDLLQFLEDHRDWVRNAVTRKETRTQELLNNEDATVPDLLYRGTAHPVHIQNDPSVRDGHVHVDVVDRMLVIRYPDWDDSNVSDPQHRAELHRVIGLWLLRKAKTHLTTRTHDLAAHHGFTFEKLFIRSQNTKWGTCSNKRNLSLNRKLIQCPDLVIDYLIIHELCHLREMNHSRQYWDLVESHYPEYRSAEAWLKRYGSVVFANY